MTFPIDAQTEFCKLVSSATGFDFEAGRMTHPLIHFPQDYGREILDSLQDLMKDPFSCLYAVMHETGHALYEQGLDATHSFTPEEMQFH